MIRKNQRFINALNIASDAVLVFAAYFMASFVRYELFDGVARIVVGLSDAWVAFIYAAVLVFVYYLAQVYGSYRFKQVEDEILTIFSINAGMTLGLMAVLYLARSLDFSRGMLFVFWLTSSALVVTKRIFVRRILRYYRKLGYNQKHVIIVGNGHFAKQYMEDIRKNPHLGFSIDGYLSRAEKPELGKCLGSYEELDSYLEKNQVDDVIVALEAHEVGLMKDVLAAADKQGAHVSIIPFYNDYFPTHPTIDVVGNTKLINMRATPLDNVGAAMLKRAMDITGALVLLILSSPLMLVAAIGVRMSSPGPVLFRQERVGKNKKIFKMLKFRSMRITGTENNGWSTGEDPRKTRFGSFIRKFSIDELPQAINVLKGEMSLVGPRPEVPFHVNHFKEEIPMYLVRQQVRPGITGWAQVNGLRGDSDIKERVEYDIWYIENWSLGLDIRILLRTMFGGWMNEEKLK